MIHQLGPIGLEKRPTYNELANYIRADPDKIVHPNRTATIDWDSIFRVNFDNTIQAISQADEASHSKDPGTAPYLPPSNRPPAPDPPPADADKTEEKPHAAWWRYLPTPIPFDLNTAITVVHGRGPVIFPDGYTPLLGGSGGGPGGGPGPGGLPNPGHVAGEAQDAIEMSEMHTQAQTVNEGSVQQQVSGHSDPIQATDAAMAEDGAPPPTPSNNIQDMLTQMERNKSQSLLTLATSLAAASRASGSSPASFLGKTAASSSSSSAAEMSSAAAAASEFVGSAASAAGSMFGNAASAAGSAAGSMLNYATIGSQMILDTAVDAAVAASAAAPLAASEAAFGPVGMAAAAATLGFAAAGGSYFVNANHASNPSAASSAAHALFLGPVQSTEQHNHMGSASSSYPTPMRPNFTRHDGASASASSPSASAAERPYTAARSEGKLQSVTVPRAITNVKKTMTKKPSHPKLILESPSSSIDKVGWWRLHATSAEVRNQLIIRKVPEVLWKGKTKYENIELLVKTIKADR